MRSSPVQLGAATFTLRNNCLQPTWNRLVSVRIDSDMGTRTVMDSHESLIAKAVGRALVAAVAVCSLVVLLDAGAKYPGLASRASSPAREPSSLEWKISAPGLAPHEFRLSANLPLEHAGMPCGAPNLALASANGDAIFDGSCSGGATVNAVGDLPAAELLSLPRDWLYHRALRF